MHGFKSAILAIFQFSRGNCSGSTVSLCLQQAHQLITRLQSYQLPIDSGLLIFITSVLFHTSIILSLTKFEFLSHCVIATFIYCVLYRCNEDIINWEMMMKGGCPFEHPVLSYTELQGCCLSLYSSFLEQNLNSQHIVPWPRLSTVCCTGAMKTFYLNSPSESVYENSLSTRSLHPLYIHPFLNKI